MRPLSLVLIAAVVGCQTAQERRLDLVKDRVAKLSALSTFRPSWCQVEAQLTGPAAARYREMFPKETATETLHYTWKIRESACELRPLDGGEAAKNYQSFLETTLCLLMQVHWVNSPFDELKVEALEDDDQGRVHIRSPGDTEGLGVFVDPKTFIVETHTKSRGVLLATYGETEGRWLPVSLEQKLEKTRFVVDRFEWDTVPVGGRRMPRSLWISLGDQSEIRPHSQLQIRECQVY